MARLTLFITALLVATAATVGAQARLAARPLLGVGQASPTAPSAADAFFDDSVLHEIRLEINAKDWQTLKENYRSNAYYPCDFRWGAETVRNVGIRSRGTASRSEVKPGLRVDFDRYSTSQTFLGLKSFVLRNNTTDFSGMHERLSMALFRRLGVPTSREAHTRLYVNGAYAGLYSIVESVDKGYLSRYYGENDGYLYKFDRNVGDPPYYMESRGSAPDAYVPHPFKPETHESDPHPEPIVDMIRTIAEAGDGTFRAAIGEFVDLTAFVKHIAIENFLVETDGMNGNAGVNNFYLYRFGNRNLHVIIPWDKSETLGNPQYPILHNIDDVPREVVNRLTARVLKYRDLLETYLDTLLACAASVVERDARDGRGWMDREIDREYSQIVDAVLADPDKPFTNDQFMTAVDDVRKFARQRSDFVIDEVGKARP